MHQEMIVAFMPCPCGSGQLYAQCCKPLHTGTPAPNALALMRSRYTAYVAGNIDYIIQTTHPDHIETNESLAQRRQKLMQFCLNTEFDGLEILSHEEGDPFSTVTFRAHLSQNGRDCSFTERSTFEKLNGHWYYLKSE